MAKGHIELDELRSLMAKHFESSRAKHRERAALVGPRSEEELETLEDLTVLHSQGRLDAGWNDVAFARYVADQRTPVAKDSSEYTTLGTEHAAQSIAYRQYVVEYDRALKAGTSEAPSPVTDALHPAKPNDRGMSLGALAREFMAVQIKLGNWSPSTAKERSRHLDYLYETIDADTPLSAISANSAREVRRVLLSTPPNRNKKRATRELSLTEQIAVEGGEALGIRTVKKYLQTYKSMFAWAVSDGHTDIDPFSNLATLRSPSKDATEGKQAFWGRELRAMLADLVSNNSGLVTQAPYKWATLIALYTGARLNEVCQLEIADIDERDGIAIISINDEGDERKALKTAASKRMVPVHSQLLALGFLRYVSSIRDDGADRLFPTLKWEEKSKYGRAVGRWFNERYLPGLGFKDKVHSFHSFRHTMVTMLGRAGVEQPVYQSIVGHQRAGITQGYNRAGFSLEQRRAALERFDPHTIPSENSDS